MREDPRIFFAQTLRHLLVKDVHFLFLGPPGDHCFGWTWKRTSWRARCYAGYPWGRHGCSWATMQVYFAREKNDVTMNTYATSNQFSLFFTYPHASMRAQQPNHFSISRCVQAFPRLIHMWAFRIWLHIDHKVIFGRFFHHFNLRPEFKSQGARM
jgi:hypothetical protein